MSGITALPNDCRAVILFHSSKNPSSIPVESVCKAFHSVLGSISCRYIVKENILKLTFTQLPDYPFLTNQKVANHLKSTCLSQASFLLLNREDPIGLQFFCSKLVGYWVRLGFFAKARETAQSLAASEEEKFKILGEIAWLEACKGFRVEALKAFESLRTEAEKTQDPLQRSVHLSAIAEYQHKAGFLKEAESTFSSALSSALLIERALAKLSRLISLTKALRNSGLYEASTKALSRAAEIDLESSDILKRRIVLTEFARLKIDPSLFIAAKEAAMRLQHPYLILAAMVPIGQKQMQVGFKKEAEESFLFIKNTLNILTPPYRSQIRNQLCVALAKSGCESLLCGLLDGIETAWKRASILVKLASAQLRNGMAESASHTLKMAIKQAHEIKADLGKEKIMEKIVEIFTELGLIENAKEIVDLHEYPSLTLFFAKTLLDRDEKESAQTYLLKLPSRSKTKRKFSKKAGNFSCSEFCGGIWEPWTRPSIILIEPR